MKGLKIADHLAKKVDSYHKGGQMPQGSMGAKQGPSGPEKVDEAHQSQPADADGNKHQIGRKDLDSLQNSMCPSCHSNLREHLIAKAAGSPDPHAE